MRNKDFEQVLLPLAPLWDYCEMEDEFTVSLFAEIINSERKSIYRWIESGGVSLLRAEEICDYLKIHPTLVWGESYYFACHEHDERKQAMYKVRYQKARERKKSAASK